jgi:hypothetical protein
MENKERITLTGRSALSILAGFIDAEDDAFDIMITWFVSQKQFFSIMTTEEKKATLRITCPGEEEVRVPFVWHQRGAPLLTEAFRLVRYQARRKAR